MRFTTRPEIVGSFGVVASTHWIGSTVGFGILEKGGNAFDAAAASAFVLQVVEPHLNGPAGEFPAIFRTSGSERVQVLCAQGAAPKKATIAHYKEEGLNIIPGSGPLATVIPGAFDGWMLLLRDYGIMSLHDILEPAIFYAENGHPLLPGAAKIISDLSHFFKSEWPSSANTWLQQGRAPTAGSIFCNPTLANTWRRVLEEVRGIRDRVQQMEVARRIWSQGFIGEEIDSFVKKTCVMDSSGERHAGILTCDDLISWSAHYEKPRVIEYNGWNVAKSDVWGQGPVLLQALSILKGIDFRNSGLCSADFIHLVIEALKLAFADREAYYGDPNFSQLPLNELFSDAHGAKRFALIEPSASQNQRPSNLPGWEKLAEGAIKRARSIRSPKHTGNSGEPTMYHLTEKRGDTVHIDVIDRWGNMISVTPSGGWLQSNPIIPNLGFALNSRAQMFWLEEGLPQSLRPGSRPRTTLSPSLAWTENGDALVFGTPGGDQQDQWQLIFLLRYLNGVDNLQEVIDMPLFHSMHFNSSFYPRNAQPGHVMLEPNIPREIIDILSGKGHEVETSSAWAIGRLTAARRSANGILRGGATPRLMQAYVVGR